MCMCMKNDLAIGEGRERKNYLELIKLFDSVVELLENKLDS